MLQDPPEVSFRPVAPRPVLQARAALSLARGEPDEEEEEDPDDDLLTYGGKKKVAPKESLMDLLSSEPPWAREEAQAAAQPVLSPQKQKQKRNILQRVRKERSNSNGTGDVPPPSSRSSAADDSSLRSKFSPARLRGNLRPTKSSSSLVDSSPPPTMTEFAPSLPKLSVKSAHGEHESMNDLADFLRNGPPATPDFKLNKKRSNQALTRRSSLTISLDSNASSNQPMKFGSLVRKISTIKRDRADSGHLDGPSGSELEDAADLQTSLRLGASQASSYMNASAAGSSNGHTPSSGSTIGAGSEYQRRQQSFSTPPSSTGRISPIKRKPPPTMFAPDEMLAIAYGQAISSPSPVFCESASSNPSSPSESRGRPSPLSSIRETSGTPPLSASREGKENVHDTPRPKRTDSLKHASDAKRYPAYSERWDGSNDTSSATAAPARRPSKTSSPAASARLSIFDTARSLLGGQDQKPAIVAQPASPTDSARRKPRPLSSPALTSPTRASFESVASTPVAGSPTTALGTAGYERHRRAYGSDTSALSSPTASKRYSFDRPPPPSSPLPEPPRHQHTRDLILIKQQQQQQQNKRQSALFNSASEGHRHHSSIDSVVDPPMSTTDRDSLAPSPPPMVNGHSGKKSRRVSTIRPVTAPAGSPGGIKHQPVVAPMVVPMDPIDLALMALRTADRAQGRAEREVRGLDADSVRVLVPALEKIKQQLVNATTLIDVVLMECTRGDERSLRGKRRPEEVPLPDSDADDEWEASGDEYETS